MRRLKTVRRPPIYPKTPGHLPCSSLTHPLPLPSRRPSVSFGGFGLRIIIEHLAFVGRDDAPPYTTFTKALDLARFPNVYMKVPALGEICHPPCPYKDIPPLVDMSYEAFGARRLMWGSDWPPVVMREGYRQSLWFTMENTRYRNEEDKEWIFGKTALSLFNLGQGLATGGGSGV